MVPKAGTGIGNRNKRKYLIPIHNKFNHRHVPLKFGESSIPWHVAFAFLIPVLGGVLQVHCQGVSPFKTHMPNMLAFLLALLVYCFALGYYVKYPVDTTTSKISAQVALISGFLATASVISVLLPRHFEPIIFVIWILLSIYVARKPILQMGRWIYHSFKDAVSHIHKKWKMITGSNNERAIPVQNISPQ